MLQHCYTKIMTFSFCPGHLDFAIIAAFKESFSTFFLKFSELYAVEFVTPDLSS